MSMATKPRDTEDAGLQAIFKELDRRALVGLPISNRVELANALGIKKQAITGWSKTPSGRALEIQRLIGVSCKVLRPDIFGIPDLPSYGKRGGRGGRR